MKENPYNELGEKLDKIASKIDSLCSTIRFAIVLFFFICFVLLFVKDNKQIEDEGSLPINTTTTESEVIE